MTFPKPKKRGRKPPKPIARKALRHSPRVAGGIFLSPRERRKRLKELCDDTFSVIIRIRDGDRCRLCNQHFRVQCAHLVSRRYYGVRWDMRNAWALCWPCHARYTFDGLGWDALVEDAVGVVAWAKLKDEARLAGIGDSTDYEALAIALRALLDEQKRESGVPDTLAEVLRKVEERHREEGVRHVLVRQA